MQHEFVQAINLILVPPKSDKEKDLRKAIELWKTTGDAKMTRKLIRGNYSVEGVILRTLAQQGNTAYVNALQKVI